MNPIIYGIYGESKTGKTTLILDIIKRISKKGLNVAAVKISDKKIEIDSKGKDTWRYAEAGSKLVVLSSLNETDFLLKQPKDISQIIYQINQLGKYDLILVEGANDKIIPKIRVGNIDKRENTIFTYSGNFKKLIEIINKEIERRKTMDKMIIIVNGKKVPLTEFPIDIIKNTICGMLKSLKGVDEIKDVEIRFKI
jgi:molybdopterin-guanine dinucleotide biosynthesis protein B